MAKIKKINFKVIQRDDDSKCRPYEVMDKLIAEHHKHLEQAEIVIAWRYGWTPDADGRLRLGQCRKASDLDRALANYDFVILLNDQIEALGVSGNDERRQFVAIIDHELCHAAKALDDDGKQLVDELGRKVWRIRKHNIEEFEAIVARHGCYLHNIESFVKAAQMKAKFPLTAIGPDVFSAATKNGAG